MKKAKFTINLPMVLKKKKTMWISSCPGLDVVSQGTTEEEARKNLAEALRLFITTCFQRGTLEEVMKDCGFSVIETGIKTTRKKIYNDKNGTDTITVPIPFYIRNNCATECRV